jgi:hypothetical protein
MDAKEGDMSSGPFASIGVHSWFSHPGIGQRSRVNAPVLNPDFEKAALAGQNPMTVHACGCPLKTQNAKPKTASSCTIVGILRSLF